MNADTRTPGCAHLPHRHARTSPSSTGTLPAPSFIQRGARLQLLLELVTHPAFEAVAGARGAQEVVEVQGAVGHKVIVADGGVVEDGQLDLMAVGNRGGELLVVGGLVGLLLGAGLPNAHLVHADGDIRVQELVALAEERVPEGPASGLQAHRLPDPHLQVPVELHGSGHGRPPGAPGSPEESQTPSPEEPGRQPAPPRLFRGPSSSSGGGAPAPGPCRGPGTAAPPPRAPPTSRGSGQPLRRPSPAPRRRKRPARASPAEGERGGSAGHGTARRESTWGVRTAPGGEEPRTRGARAGPGWGAGGTGARTARLGPARPGADGAGAAPPRP